MAPRLIVLLAAAAALNGAARAAPPVPWRDFGAEPFEEAARDGKPVFLLLTAPWNWDHFLLPGRLFANEDVRRALAEDAIPVRVDASVFPELRSLWTIRSGLLPSFHFLDATGAPLASFPPLGEEEFLFYLGEHATPEEVPAAPRPEPEPTVAMRAGPLSDLLARFLAGGLVRGEIDVAPPHLEPDVALLAFLSEWAALRGDRGTRDLVDAQLLLLLSTPLADPVDGGFHRAYATPDRATVHHEKVLRSNAELGALLATRFGATGRLEMGRDALLMLRFLNEGLRTRGTTLYVGSRAADVFDEGNTELLLEGPSYYRMGDEGRRHSGRPPVSAEIPVGANWRLHQALAEYARAYHDVRMPRAILRGGRVLLAEAFEEDGSAKRLLGVAGSGNLRDQGDAGSGLLVYYGVSGRPMALEAAVALAETMLERFAEDGALLDVARDADVPAFVRTLRPDPAFHGAALRFLAELATVTRESRWHDAALRGLEAWSSSIPADGRGAGELGRAALRAEAPGPLLVIRADPETGRGDELRDLAYGLPDPMILVRWVEPGDRRVAERFGLPDDDGDPAIWLVWGETSPALREAVTLRRAWQRARERIRSAPLEP